MLIDERNKKHIKLQYGNIYRRNEFNINDLIVLFWGLKFIEWVSFSEHTRLIKAIYS